MLFRSRFSVVCLCQRTVRPGGGAILAGELFVGEAEGHLGGAGTVSISSQKNPHMLCLGEFTSSAELGGSGQMQCSDGSSATFRFDRLSLFHVHGSGRFSRGPMSFVYGIPAVEAGRYLTLPDGKKLLHNGTELVLAER